MVSTHFLKTSVTVLPIISVHPVFVRRRWRHWALDRSVHSEFVRAGAAGGRVDSVLRTQVLQERE
jgi:hypothetical protein